jgi:hypothetical protein
MEDALQESSQAALGLLPECLSRLRVREPAILSFGRSTRWTDFLKWINDITWASAWAKYGVLDANGQPAAAPPRPITRRVS